MRGLDVSSLPHPQPPELSDESAQPTARIQGTYREYGDTAGYTHPYPFGGAGLLVSGDGNVIAVGDRWGTLLFLMIRHWYEWDKLFLNAPVRLISCRGRP